MCALKLPPVVETGCRLYAELAANKAVGLWTMRCAHRPACRGQRFALTTAPTFDHKPHSLLPLFVEPEPSNARSKEATTILPRGALWPVVDRWNYIINGLSVIVNKMGDP